MAVELRELTISRPPPPEVLATLPPPSGLKWDQIGPSKPRAGREVLRVHTCTYTHTHRHTYARIQSHTHTEREIEREREREKRSHTHIRTHTQEFTHSLRQRAHTHTSSRPSPCLLVFLSPSLPLSLSTTHQVFSIVLARELTKKTAFTAKEVAKFGIPDLGYADYIKAGHAYFVPAPPPLPDPPPLLV